MPVNEVILPSGCLKSWVFHDNLIGVKYCYKNLTTRRGVAPLILLRHIWGTLYNWGGKISLIYQQQCYPGWSCCILDNCSILSSLWNHWVIITQNVVSMAITQELQQVLKSVRCSKQDRLFIQISLYFIGQNGGVSLPPHSERS